MPHNERDGSDSVRIDVRAGQGPQVLKLVLNLPSPEPRLF